MTDTTAGERLREARRKAGLSAEELGRKAGQELGRDKPISPSAVRNQENGTNGIPVDTAHAYAKILGISPLYLLWGATEADFDLGDAPAQPEENANAAPQSQDGDWSDLQIRALRVCSGNWLPEMFNPGKTPDESFIWVGVPGWSAEEDDLEAYEVIDHTLEPTYRRGTYLIVAPVERAPVTHKAHVLAAKFRGTEIVNAVRSIWETKTGLLLFPINDDNGENLVLVNQGEVNDELWIDGVVIASYYVDRPQGRALSIPPSPIDRAKDLPPEIDPFAAAAALRRDLRAVHIDEELDVDEDFEGTRLDPGPREDE